MKNKIFGMIFFLCAFLIFSGCDKEKEKKLMIGISPDYPPFAFEYKNEFIGFDVELTNAICTRLGYKAEFKKMKFEDLFLALENKTVDVIVSAISETEERGKKFDFSHSYYSPKFALIYKRENSRKVRSVDDVDGLIGVEKGTTMSDDLRFHVVNYASELLNQEKNEVEKKDKNVKNMNFNLINFSLEEERNYVSEGINSDENDEEEENEKEVLKSGEEKKDKKEDVEKMIEIGENSQFEKIKLYNSHSDLLKALEKEEVIAIFTEVLQAEVATQNDRDLTFIPIDELDEHQHQYHYGFVFNKGSKLTEKFNKIIDEMDSEGKIDILKLRWFSGYGMYNRFGKE
jgi:ABC-type amino acid transport substrate-binding protein